MEFVLKIWMIFRRPKREKWMCRGKPRHLGTSGIYLKALCHLFRMARVTRPVETVGQFHQTGWLLPALWKWSSVFYITGLWCPPSRAYAVYVVVARNDEWCVWLSECKQNRKLETLRPELVYSVFLFSTTTLSGQGWDLSREIFGMYSMMSATSRRNGYWLSFLSDAAEFYNFLAALNTSQSPLSRERDERGSRYLRISIPPWLWRPTGPFDFQVYSTWYPFSVCTISLRLVCNFLRMPSLLWFWWVQSSRLHLGLQ